MSIRNIFVIIAVVVTILIGALGAAAFGLRAASVEVDQANHMRYQSYLLADELRQSSDDLTRLARTYVVSGDERYEQQYQAILDIRNGTKPRPRNYERIYWDFVAAGETKPRPDGETIALEELMKQAGFTEAEFAKLQEAQANSDGLVKTETIAMNAVKGRFEDAQGGFTVSAPPISNWPDDCCTVRPTISTKRRSSNRWMTSSSSSTSAPRKRLRLRAPNAFPC